MRTYINLKQKIKYFLINFQKNCVVNLEKGHFKGVLDVVNRFLEIIKPKKIFLGNKDFQQLVLIKKHIMKK